MLGMFLEESGSARLLPNTDVSCSSAWSLAGTAPSSMSAYLPTLPRCPRREAEQCWRCSPGCLVSALRA